MRGKLTAQIIPAHPQDVPGLTGLRFVAAFSVLIGHGLSTLASHETPLGWIYWVKQLSGFGMTLFFVLSGFVIHYNYAALLKNEGARGVAAYLWARFARLYPLFLLMLLAYVLVSSRFRDLLGGHPERFESTLIALPYYLTSIHSWLYVPIQGNALVSAIGGGSPVTWSISTEWFFYFIYPCIAFSILKSQRWWIAFCAMLMWSAVWAAFAAGVYDRMPVIDAWGVLHFGAVASVNTNQQDSFVRWLIYLSPYLRVGEFILGALLAQFYVLMRNRPVSEIEYVIGSFVLLIAMLSVPWLTYQMYDPAVDMNLFRKLNTNFALAPTAAAVVFCAARYRSLTAVLNTRPVVALGEASYSIYLVHQIVLSTSERFFPSGLHNLPFDLVKLMAEYAMVFLLSLALYSLYETPTRRWLRKQWGDGRRVAMLAATPLILALIIVAIPR